MCISEKLTGLFNKKNKNKTAGSDGSDFFWKYINQIISKTPLAYGREAKLGPLLGRGSKPVTS